MSARAFFDIGTLDAPGHCNHRAIVELNTTAAYRAIKGIDGDRLTQQDLAEFIEDWQDAIKAFEKPGDETTMSLKAAAEAIRNVTITEQSKADHGVQSS